MSWIKLILLVLQVVRSFATYARVKGLIAAGEQQAIAAALQQHLKDIEANETTRLDQRRRNAAVPTDRSLPDDGFRRD